MGRKRQASKGKKIKPHFWVFCEGKTEESYVCFLRSKYRIPIEIVPKIIGSNISEKIIKRYKKGKPTHEKDIDFLILKIMGRKKLPAYQGVTIEDIAAEGKAIVRIDDMVVFVPGAIPGDVVDLQVTRKRKKYREARITKYVSYSDLRIDPFCSHFGTCGGCKWQHLPYHNQLQYKEKQVRDALQRIGKIDIAESFPIIGAEETRFYRNKLEYTFSNHRWLTGDETATDHIIENRNALGFHVAGRFDRIVDVEKCYLQSDPSNLIRNTVKAFAHEKGLSFYDHNTNEGLLRNLIIRTASTGELMVVLSVRSTMNRWCMRCWMTCTVRWRGSPA